MRAVTMILLMRSLAFASGISGTWALSHDTRASAAPAFVRIDQDGDRLRVLKIMAGRDGKRLEQIVLDVASIQSTPTGVEIRMHGETWMINAAGELIINRDGQRFVLEPGVQEAVQ